jgi:Icc-related predicted phosphoesterase
MPPKIKRVSDATSRKFQKRICHVSDTHGGFPRLHGRYDVVVHTGDFFPNSHHVFSNKNLEMAFQLQWLRDNIPNIKQWLNGHTLIYVPGNHDFLHPDMMEYELQNAGVKAFGIANRLLSFEGTTFFGFPYVPTIDGSWNYERAVPEMHQECEKMAEVLNQTFVDVLCCHAPPYGCLDLTYGNEVIGSTVIATMLDYKVARDMLPPVLLCGHVHEANGLRIRNGQLVSNAATTYQVIEV